MDRDNITRTGARAPGVGRRKSPEWRCSTERVSSDSERRVHAAAEGTKDGSKPDPCDGHAGSKLNRSMIREGPCLIGQPWSRTEGKPAVRNLREERGNVGIIRSPLRASLLPDPPPQNCAGFTIGNGLRQSLNHR